MCARQQDTSDRKALDFARRAVSLRRQKSWGMATGFSSLALAAPSLVFMNRYPALVPSAYLGAVPLGLIAIAALALPWAAAANAGLNRMIEDAKKSQDKRTVGVLLDAYQEYADLAHRNQYHRARSEVLPLIEADLRQNLTAILPQVEENDALLFTPAQRKTLRLLLRNSDSGVVWSALQALGKIGNRADLPMVQQLAVGAWNAAVKRGLADTARSTCAQILARLSEQNNTQTLLRGSAGPEEFSAELLRPATPQVNRTDAEQLLRAEQRDSASEER